MKEYDLIIIGSGSAMNIVDPMIQENPNIRIAVIDFYSTPRNWFGRSRRLGTWALIPRSGRLASNS